MYNLAGFLCNYWIFPVGQSVSPILCLSWPYQCWYWSTVHTTITGLPHLLWLFLLCTTDQMMSVPVPTWLPGCCLAAACIPPSPHLVLYLAWREVTLRYVSWSGSADWQSKHSHFTPPPPWPGSPSPSWETSSPPDSPVFPPKCGSEC